MADLLKWARDRKKQVQGAYHQVNPFDDGRTYDTNQRGVAPGTSNPVNIRSDDTPGFQWTNNSLTRGFSRGFDQVNPIDNNRTWKQRAPVGQNRTAYQQLMETGLTGSFIQPAKNTFAKSMNTVGAGVAGIGGLGWAGYESIFGDDESYQNALNITQMTTDELLRNGMWGRGGYLTPEQASSSGGGWEGMKENFIKPTAQATADIAPWVIPAGKFVPKGASTPVKALIMGGENAAVGAPVSAANQWVQTGEVNPKQVFKDAALAFGIGSAFPVASSVTRKAVGPTVTKIANTDVPTPKLNPAQRHPAVMALDDTMARLNDQRGQMLARGMSEKAPAVKQNAKAYAMALAEKNRTLKSINEGGYIKLPGKSNEPKPTPIAAMDEATKQAEATNLMQFIKSPFSSADDVAKARARMKELAGTPPSAPPKKPLLKSLLGNEEGFVKIPGREPKQPKPVLKQNLPETSKPQIPGAPGPKGTPKQGQKLLTKELQKLEDTSPRPPSTLNVDKFNVSKKAKKALNETVEEMKPMIEQKIGKRLSNKEVRDTARATTAVLQNGKTREATKKYLAARLKLAEQNAALIKKRAEGTITDAEMKQLRRGILEQKAAATDAGRTLQAHKQVADPHQANILDVMTDQIQKQTDDLAAVQAALDKLPKNPTGKELANFYRTFVKASKEDWLDKFRYTNMLSSPLTHIVNVSSNLSGVAGIAPVQKLFEGATDSAKHVLTFGKKPKTMYAGEAGAYYKGVAKSWKDASQKFKDVMSGKETMTNPDIDALYNIPLATKGIKGQADKVLSFVPKLLEASDQFATTLTKGGERGALKYRMGKGVKYTAAQVDDMVDDAARYRVFRQELGKQGQGHLLDMIDFVPRQVSKARRSSNPYVRQIAKFTFPFINTPTNLFKQGIEYSPAGIFTLHGSANKTSQAAKALMGTTTMTMIAGALAAGGDLTFGEPTDPKQRDAFRAEGKQPYAFRLPGTDKWIGYSKTHPAIGFNFAMVAAYKDAMDKGSVDQSTLDKFAASASGVLGFFRDQSYMKSLGDMTSIMQAKDGARLSDIVANQATNTANQLMPFKSMTSWIGRQIDPTQRKVDYDAGTPQQIWQGIVKDIPGLNKGVPARKNPYTGEDLKNDNPILNSFSPLRVTNDRGFGNTTGLNIDQREQLRDLPADQKEPFRRGIIEEKALNKEVTNEKEKIKREDEKAILNAGKQTGGEGDIKQLSSGKFYTKVGNSFETFDTKEAAEKAVAVNKFKSSGQKKLEVGDKVYLKSDNEQGYTVKTKVQYEYDQVDSKATLDMDRAKGADDLEGWATAAGAKYEAMKKLRDSYDPETEQDKINDITKKMEDLQDTADKYAEQGGFKKGKSGKGARKGFQAPNQNAIPLFKSSDVADLVASATVKSPGRMRRKF